MISQTQINKIVFGWLPSSFLDRIGMLRRYRLTDNKEVSNYIIDFVDGTSFHGGLCDRWKGIISLYAFCKATNRVFRLNYTYPFDLIRFQSPNCYDWSLKQEQISRSFWRCRMLRMVGQPNMDRLLSSPLHKQLHCYANRDWVPQINAHFGKNYQWGELFEELFSPSPLLQEKLQLFHPFTANPYIAVAFRMQNLMGDFPEYKYEPVDSDKQKYLLSRCLEYIEQLHQEYSMPILVTSDSEKLTQHVDHLPYVFTNAGAAVHVDTLSGAPEKKYLKSFVDFYLLAGAEKVYCAGTKEMYPSEFPMYAALLHQHPFERVELS